MTTILIVGSGGFGREVHQYALDTFGGDAEKTIGGFLDDNPRALDRYDHPASIVGTIQDYEPKPGEELICAIGNPLPKRACVETLLARGAVFRSLVHPTAYLGPRVHLGVGVVIAPGAILSADISLGDFSMINLGCTIGHDARIGAWATLSCQGDVTGFVHIGEACFLGSRASIIPGKTVGDGATVGAGAVVIADVPAGQTVFGNPARRIG